MDKGIVIKTEDLNQLEERGKFQMTREEFDKVVQKRELGTMFVGDKVEEAVRTK